MWKSTTVHIAIIKLKEILTWKDILEEFIQPYSKKSNVGEDITGARVHTPVTESDEMNVKDEINNPELFEDSIIVLQIYKLLQRMKIKQI